MCLVVFAECTLKFKDLSDVILTNINLYAIVEETIVIQEGNALSCANKNNNG